MSIFFLNNENAVPRCWTGSELSGPIVSCALIHELHSLIELATSNLKVRLPNFTSPMGRQSRTPKTIGKTRGAWTTKTYVTAGRFGVRRPGRRCEG